jgi:hypothetical protein
MCTDDFLNDFKEENLARDWNIEMKLHQKK